MSESYRTIKASYSVDLIEAMRINREIGEMQRTYGGLIALDCSKVGKINSSAIGILLHTWKTLDNSQNDLVILDPSEVFMSMLKGTNLHKVFKIIIST